MIDDIRRQEVAAKLSGEAQAWRDMFPDEVCDLGDVSALMQDLCHFAGLRGKVSCGGIFQRFADLIDRPTCEMTECPIDHGSRSWGMRCSSCGTEFEHEKPSYGWRYCPNCGAEVVDEPASRAVTQQR